MSLKEEEQTTNVTFALSRGGSYALDSLKELGISDRTIAIGMECSLLSMISKELTYLSSKSIEPSGIHGSESLENLLKLLLERKSVGEPS